MTDLYRAYLSGRCSDGFELGKGSRAHWVWGINQTAMCGAKAGRRSALGFVKVELPVPTWLTMCPRCESKKNRMSPGVLVATL